jgi:predicted 2-oxoglutarate/Fe(II)-dependent dioxygenase YbiX
MFFGGKKLKDYIEVFNNIVPSTLCDEIINYYEFSDKWEDSEISKRGVVKKIRNCMAINLSDNNDKSIFDEKLYKIVAGALKKYVSKYSPLEHIVSSDEGYQLLKYEEESFYKYHVDIGKDVPRTLSLSLTLNDNYKGGELSFFKGRYKVKTKKGMGVMFPSNFMYDHAVLPVKKGVRYSIVTWYN